MDMIHFDEVSRMTRLSKRQLRRLWTSGDFPEPVRISPRRLAWPAAALEAWFQDRAAERGLSQQKERVS